MTMTLLLLVPVLVLAVVGLFAFAGCSSFSAAEETPAPAPAQNPPPGTPPGTTPPVTTPPPVVKTYPEVILGETGLRCYWRLAEPAGAVQADDSEPTLKQPGTYVDATQGVGGALALGKLTSDTAVFFDAISSHVDVPWHEQVNPPLNFSIEAWVLPELTSNNPAVIVGSYDPGKFHGFVLEALRDATGALIMQGRIGDGSKFTSLKVGMGTGTANNGWRHVVMTYQSTPSELRLYVNAGPTPFTSKLPASPADPPVNYIAVQGPVGPSFRIGAGRLSAAALARFFFRGRIDEVALYDVVLQPSQIQDHYDKALSK
jgi:hypothetical protein